MNELENQVMIMNLSISVFTGEKIDRDVSDTIAATHHTTAHEAGRFSKQIIGKQALKGIKSFATVARTTHYDRTLPYSDNGGRLLSVTGFMDYTTSMRGIRANFVREVDIFCDVYPRLIEDAKTRLNGMFNVDDYPPIDSLRGRFSFEIAAEPMPSSKNWFLEMADDTMQHLRAHHDERKDAKLEHAIKDVYRRVADVAQKMATKLDDKDGVFRDSLITNISELANLLPTLNITNDPQLAQIASDLAALTAHSPDALRADPTYRTDAAAKAQAVYDKASLFM